MYESHRQPLLPREAFLRRLAGHVVRALALILIAIALGMAGFRLTEHYTLLDAFLNTCMLLGGMGQVNPIATNAGKVFAGFFALFAGLLFIAVSTLLVAPFAHRLLHALHVERGS